MHVKHCTAAPAYTAIRWHPDKNTDNPEATERFQQIAAAYEALCEEQQVVCQFFSAEDFLYAGVFFSAEDFFYAGAHTPSCTCARVSRADTAFFFAS